MLFSGRAVARGFGAASCVCGKGKWNERRWRYRRVGVYQATLWSEPTPKPITGSVRWRT